MQFIQKLLILFSARCCSQDPCANHPILDDGKYGKNSINKKFKYKYQALCSYKLVFDFKTNSGSLSYLFGKEFALSEDKIWCWKNN